MDLDVDELRPRYRLCRAGFGLMALSLGLLCLSDVSWLAYAFSGNDDLRRILISEWWDWVVGAPITWASLLGSYLLWGRWKEPVWQNRVGALVLLNFLDLITWGIDHSAELGLGVKITEASHPWLRHSLTTGFGWIELYLAASLATDLILHLGHQPPEFSKSAASFGLIGLTITALIFITQTHWAGGWPLAVKPFWLRTPLGFLLWTGQNLIGAAMGFLVSALCVVAASRSGHYLRELEAHAGRDHELLKSRSESENESF